MRRRRHLRLRSIRSPRNWLLAGESCLALLLARLGLATMRLPALSTTGCRVFASLGRADGPAGLAQAREAAAWVNRASQFLPGMLCLPQALATQWLVARRGGGCTLHVGIATGVGGFRSHAWATFGRYVLIGGAEAAGNYREILRSDGRAAAPFEQPA